ncbi:MAG: sigma-70 family RNA polymerase sigma factor [Clostridiales Family XIII bacterium]|jgi:RNA polymerase sporulation-specific sigma factor|nr:sigma-70 family RNA polymerase sigma factor [Clostridiales Family XIII bacterium]
MKEAHSGKYDTYSDAALAQRAADGDEIALECIYARFREIIRMKSNLFFIVGGDRDDLIQEGMIGMFHAIMEYNADRGASFATFAELCVERQMMTAIKSAARLKHAPLNTSLSISESHETTDGEACMSIEDVLADRYAPSPEDDVLFRDQLNSIERDRDRIFSKLERVVWDEFKQGRTYTEIADMLGKTPKAIDNAIQRMKKKVEKHMDMY